MKRKISWKLFLLPTLMLLLAAAVYSRLPEQIPGHFSFTGEVDRYDSKITIFIPGLITLAIPALNEILRRIDPKKQNYEKFGQESVSILFFIELVLLATELLVILFALGHPMSIQRIVPVLTGILLMLCGNFMPRFRQNFYWGIKTPWTLSDETVWFKTHRFGGKVFFIGGLAMAFLGFVPNAWSLPFFLILTAALVLAPVLYSYLEYRKIN